MTIQSAAQKASFQILCLPSPQRQVTGRPVCCDLLGLAVTHVPRGALWFTLCGNLNTVAAATLNQAAGVVLCGGFSWPEEAVEAAREHGVNLLASPLPSFEAAEAAARWEN